MRPAGHIERNLVWVLAVGAAAWAGAAAADQSINNFTIDGGGGTSSAGQYVVSGTAGQPDAGTLGGGSYVVDGGFWCGGSNTTSVPSAPPAEKFVTQVEPASPSPCQGSTVIGFTLGRPEVVRVEIYDPTGRRVRTILSTPMGPGRHSATWNGADDHGSSVASGVYLIKFTIGATQKLQKLVVIR